MEKKYLHCTVYRHDDTVFFNPLTLSESYLVSQLAQQHQKVEVVCSVTSKSHYKSMFG